MPAYQTLIIKIDYEELKPDTYRGVVALTEGAVEILRINTKDMEADYEAVKRALAGTCEACADDSTVMNFRILQGVLPIQIRLNYLFEAIQDCLPKMKV